MVVIMARTVRFVVAVREAGGGTDFCEGVLFNLSIPADSGLATGISDRTKEGLPLFHFVLVAPMPENTCREVTANSLQVFLRLNLSGRLLQPSGVHSELLSVRHVSLNRL